MDKTRSGPNSVFSLVFFFLIIWVSFFPVPTYGYSWKIILAILLLSANYILYLRRIKINSIFTRNYDLVLFLYLIYVAAGTFFAGNKQVARDYYFIYLVPVPLLYYTFKSEFFRLRNKKIFLVMICFCATAVSLLGIIEYLFRCNFIYEYLVKNVFYTYFSIHHRSMSTQFVPQVLATYLASCLAFTYYFLFRAKRLLFRIVWLISALVIALGVITTSTRGVLLAVFISSAVYAFFKSKKMFLMVLSLFLILFAFLSFHLPSPALSRLSPQSIICGVAPRLERWNVALEMSKDHPLSGIGLGHYNMYFERYTDLDFTHYDKNADNMFLTILAESGIPALILFILFLANLFGDIFRHLRREGANSDLLLAVAASALAILLSMFFTLEALYWPSLLYLFWIFCGMIASLLNNDGNN